MAKKEREARLPEPPHKATGDRIRSARLAASKTTQALAYEAGIAEMTLRNYEAGRRVPDLDVADRLARLLGVTIDWLARGDEG